MFTGFIKCDCNGVCIEVNPFICTTSTSTSTTTSTSTSTTTTTTTIAITSICFCIHLEGGGCAYQIELPILGNAPFQNGRPVYNITGDANGTVYYDGTQWIYASEELAPLLQPLLNSSYYPIGTYSEWGELDTTYFMDSSTSGPCPTTTTTTTAANNRWQYEYLSYTCTLCEIIEYGSLYNSNPLTLDNFYQYGDIVITPYALLGVDTGISDASIPDTGVATCEEINCTPTTTTTTRKPIDCKRYVVSASGVAPATGSWTALDCLGEAVSGVTTEFNSITPCIDIDTFVPINTLIKQIIDCNVLICEEFQLQATGVDASWSALNCLGENVGGSIPGAGSTISTGCIESATLNIINGDIKDITPC